MTDFAQKLMSDAQTVSSDESVLSANTILNSSLSSTKSLYRIGLWPIISVSEPEIGMGIGLVLGALLDQWPSVYVYRLLSQISGTPSSYDWRIEDTQFGVDDWEIEGLDENVAIWGNFEAESNRFHLELSVEDDAREDDSILELNYDSDSLAEMLNQLPAMSTTVMNWLNNAPSDSKSPFQAISSVNSQLLRDFLEDIFHWELDYYLELWGQGSNSENVLDSQNGLIETANDLGSDFGAWIVSKSITRFILVGQTSWHEWLLPTVSNTASSLVQYPVASLVLGTILFRLGNQLEAFDLLETSITKHPQYTKSYLALGGMYLKLHEDMSAIDVFQRAIEAHAADSEIYLRYASIMDSLAEHQLELKTGTSRVSAAGRPFIERYALTQSDSTALSLHESSAAYRHVIELDSSSIDALVHLVLDMLALGDSGAWPYFSQLIDQDKDGTFTATVIEQVAESDLNKAVDVLRAVSARKPQVISVRFNLARAYLAMELHKEAKSELEAISTSSIPPHLRNLLSRLRLSADDPDFDRRMGEIQDILNANSQVDTMDIEYLEEIIKKEPEFSEGYRLLAESYLSWNESDDALEVLLDGQKTAPFDTSLILLLAKVLWGVDESDLAFAYLDKGLDQNRRNASLLSLMGRFLFDEGEDASAKEYLRQAEVVDPLDSELSATRVYIANTLIGGKKRQ